MKIENTVAFVTGANRGIGKALVEELKARGAKKIYAAARDPKTITTSGVIAVELDVTKPEQVAAAAKLAHDANLVINNAGIATTTEILAKDAMDTMRREYETNVFGLLDVSRAFAKQLAGGSLVNLLSVVSWVTTPLLSTYAASKSAAWSVTNALRHELREQKTVVSGVHVGFVDTDMTHGIEAPKVTAAHVAKTILDGVARGDEEIIVDDFSKQAHGALATSGYIHMRL